MKYILLLLGILPLTIFPIKAFSTEEKEEKEKIFHLIGDMSLIFSKEKSMYNLNLEMGHTQHSTYSKIKINFDECTVHFWEKITFPKILFGANLFESTNHKIVLELGRKPFREVLDSKFLLPSFFNGVSVKYVLDRIEGKLSVDQSLFYDLDADKKRPLVLTTLGFSNISQTGAYIKLGYLYLGGKNQTLRATFGQKSAFKGLPIDLYVAGLSNIKNPDDRGFCVGSKLGDLKEAGDLSFDFYYRYIRNTDKEHGVFCVLNYKIKKDLDLINSYSWKDTSGNDYKTQIKYSF